MSNVLEILGQETILGKEFTIYNTKDNPLFLAKSIAEMIEYNKTKQGYYDVSAMLRVVDEDEKVKIRTTINNPSGSELWFLSEYGMYEVLMQSRKPIAKEFKKEIKYILKEIRENGGYINPNATEEQVEKLVENYSMRSITKQIHDCEIMQLEGLVNQIIETNTASGKRDRVDKRLKKLDKTEYKQHLRRHIRKAIETRPYSSDIKLHAVEMAIRDRLIIALTDNVLETTNRKYGQLL